MARSTRTRPAWAALLGVLALALVSLGACAPQETGVTVALLLPESKTARYEALDRPFFTERLAELGDYRVLYSNADQDAAKQQAQAEAALASGVAVLVLDPVDSAAAVSIVIAANAAGVPVIAYDRFIEGGEIAYYVSFDNEAIGRLQGTALVERLAEDGAPGGILMVNGSPTDSNALEFKRGANQAVAAGDLTVLAEFDTPDWSPNQAQDWVAAQITQFGERIIGVYAANDGTAGGAIAALKAAGADPFPVVTGQDAELAAIQRIISGDQYMTIYKDIRAEATLAAEVAVALIEGRPIVSDLTISGVPATLLTAQVVTVDTVLSTVIADGIYTIDQICTPEYAAACAAAGIR